MMLYVEDNKYVNPQELAYIEKDNGTGSKAIVQGREVTFSIPPKALVELINRELHDQAVNSPSWGSRRK